MIFGVHVWDYVVRKGTSIFHRTSGRGLFSLLWPNCHTSKFTLEGGTLARPNGDSNSERLIRLVELNCFVSREVSFVGDLREPILNPLSENKAEKGGYKRERRAVRNTP
jgi:hypothetical protein